MVKISMKHGVCLIGLLRIRLSLRRLDVFVDIDFMTHVHFMLNRIMLLVV